MEFEVKTKVFSNASVRRQFLDDVLAAFESAHGHVELICLYEGFEPIFKRMADSDEDSHDVMTLNIINVRYQALHIRHDEEQERMVRLFTELEEKNNAY